MKTSCTILISHFHSLAFLKAAIRQFDKHRTDSIEQNIIVIDQSSIPYYTEMCESLHNEFGNRADITIVHTPDLYSGFGIDYVLRIVEIKTEYIAQFHSDSFAISDKFLSLPISLIEEYNLSFVGQLQFINGKENLASIYPPSPFFAMAQCFNVARTETYLELSLIAGFTRFHNRPQSGLEFTSNVWSDWAKEDYENRGSDDDVVAFHWQDKNKRVNKLGLAITGYVQPNFGRLIEDVVFHFGSANEARGVMASMPELYQHYTQRINENYDDELIEEMVNLAQSNKSPEMEILNRNFWNGKLKHSFPTSYEMNKRIEELKQ